MSISSIYKYAAKLELKQDLFNAGQQNKVITEIITVDSSIENISVFCEKRKKGEWKELPKEMPLNSVWNGTKFNLPQPYASWSLDEESGEWNSPIAKPSSNPIFTMSVTDKNGDLSELTIDTYRFIWNETDQRWEGDNRQDNNNYYWDPDNSTWNLID